MKILNVIGLFIYIVFYLCFELKMYLQTKSGIKTVLIGRGNKPKKTLIIEIIVTITIFITACVQFLSIITVSRLPFIFQNDIVGQFGCIISALGLVIFNIAIVTMRDSWRQGIDYNQHSKLITNGIYRYSRNPAYFGLDLFCLGMALAFSNALNIAFAGATMIVMHFMILEEEKYLRVAFGEQYMKYESSTGRYF